jgi:hypothetical protein
MFFDDPTFIRGRDGRIYEIRDPDREGGAAVFFLAIFMGIAYAMYSAYLWLLEHYWMVASISLVGFITWVGWVYDDYQKERRYDAIIKKIWAFAMVIAGFVIASNGFSAAVKGDRLLRAIQGEWQQAASGFTLNIARDKFILASPKDQVTIEAACQMQYDPGGFAIIEVQGKQFKGTKTEANSTPFTQTFYCRVVDRKLTLQGGGEVLEFDRK